MDLEAAPPLAEDVLNSFETWVSDVLRLPVDNFDPAALVSCKAFAIVLNAIDEDFFPEAWVEKISDYDLETKWTLKVQNLKKVLSKTFQYLHDTEKLTLKSSMVDERMFAENHDLEQISKVIYFVFGCAFFGRNKSKYISSIQHIPESLQHLIVYILKHLHQLSSSNGSTENGNDTIYDDGQDMDERVVKLQKENEDLRSKCEQLQEELDKLVESDTMADAENNNEALRKRNRDLNEEIIEMAGKMDAMKMTLEQKEVDLHDANAKLNSFRQFEDDYRKMSDQNEELRASARDVDRLQREVESLRKAATDRVSDKKEIDYLRARCADLHAKLAETDEEKAKVQNFKLRIASLEHQLDEKKEECNKLQVKISKLELDIAEMKQQNIAAQNKNDELREEKMKLEEKVFYLEHSASMQNTNNSLLHDLSTADEKSTAGDDSFNLLINQERQLQQLRERLKELEELDLESQSGEWIKAKRKAVELEKELDLAREMSAEMKMTIQKLKNDLENSNGQVSNSTDVGGLKCTIDEQCAHIARLKDELRAAEERVQAATQSKIEAEETAKKFEERVVKAKTLLDNMEKRQAFSENGYSIQEFDALRQEIDQKEKKIKHLEETLDQIQRKNEEEQRLVSTAFYEQSHLLNRSLADQEHPRERSFLSKLRASSTTYLSVPVVFVAILVAFFFWRCNEISRPAPEVL